MLGFNRLGLRETFNRKLFLTVLLIAISQFNFGFDNQGFASIQAMDAFAKSFGTYDPEKDEYYLEPQWKSYFNGFTYLGQAFGVIVGSWVSKRFGRRWCMFSMSIWAVICATIIITSRTPTQILIGRVFNYIYIGMELAVVPVFQSEITPQRARGFIVGTYQISLNIGGLVINCISRGTSSLEGRQEYLIPFGLFYVIPLFVISCIWFVPESPRWLMLKDRPDEALASLRLLREGKHTDAQILSEFDMIQQGISQEREREAGNFLDIFRGTNLRRTMIVMGANFFLQATGQVFNAQYSALFVKSLGTVNPFNITIAITLVQTFTALLAMVLTDSLGRRRPLLTGATIQMAALMVMGGLGAAGANKAVEGGKERISGIVAMMVVFAFGYALGWAPAAHILSAEIPSNLVRDVTYRTASAMNVAVQFAWGFSIPYITDAPYANLGAQVGFIFGGIAVLSIVFAFFCVPDCSGRSLEEVDQLFASGLNVRKFQDTRLAGDDDDSQNKLGRRETEDGGVASHAEA